MHILVCAAEICLPRNWGEKSGKNGESGVGSNRSRSKNIVLALPVFTFQFLFSFHLFGHLFVFLLPDFTVRQRLCNAFWHVSQCLERVGSWPCGGVRVYRSVCVACSCAALALMKKSCGCASALYRPFYEKWLNSLKILCPGRQNGRFRGEASPFTIEWEC